MQGRVKFFEAGDNNAWRMRMHILALVIGLALGVYNFNSAGISADTVSMYLLIQLLPYVTYVLMTLKSSVLFTMVSPPIIIFFTQMFFQMMHADKIAQGQGLVYQPHLLSIVVTVPTAIIATAVCALVSYLIRRFKI